MIELLSIVLLVLLIAVAALLIYAATRPDTFGVQRTTRVNASPEKIFPLINDFQHFRAWSPYEKLDPAMTRTLSGAASGIGAVYAWEGKGNAGAGRMEIVESVPPFRVAIRLDFSKPFKAHNVVEFTLAPEGKGTNVTWAMHGRSPYMAKVMHVVFNMDRMIGSDFEAGLANLKALAER